MVVASKVSVASKVYIVPLSFTIYTTRYPKYIIGDKGNESQSASL